MGDGEEQPVLMKLKTKNRIINRDIFVSYFLHIFSKSGIGLLVGIDFFRRIALFSVARYLYFSIGIGVEPGTINKP